MDTKIWELPESGWYIRFFLWTWNASPQNLNICKLFWGTVFLPISLWVSIPAAAERHSVSGFAVFWLISGSVVMSLGLYISAGIGFFVALCYLLNDLHRRMKADRTPAEQKSQFANQDRTLNRLIGMITMVDTCLSKITSVLRKSRLLIALGSSLSLVVKMLDYLIFVPISWVGTKIIGKPALLLMEYVKEAKHKFCPIIVLVPRKRT